MTKASLQPFPRYECFIFFRRLYWPTRPAGYVTNLNCISTPITLNNSEINPLNPDLVAREMCAIDPPLRLEGPNFGRGGGKWWMEARENGLWGSWFGLWWQFSSKYLIKLQFILKQGLTIRIREKYCCCCKALWCSFRKIARKTWIRGTPEKNYQNR